MQKKQLPSQQPFNIAGKENKTKQHAWWQRGSSNNPRSKEST